MYTFRGIYWKYLIRIKGWSSRILNFFAKYLGLSGRYPVNKSEIDQIFQKWEYESFDISRISKMERYTLYLDDFTISER